MSAAKWPYSVTAADDIWMRDWSSGGHVTSTRRSLYPGLRNATLGFSFYWNRQKFEYFRHCVLSVVDNRTHARDPIDSKY